MELPMIELSERCPGSGRGVTASDTKHPGIAPGAQVPFKCECGVEFELAVTTDRPRLRGEMWITSTSYNPHEKFYPLAAVPDHDRPRTVVDVEHVDLVLPEGLFVLQVDDYEHQEVVGLFHNLGDALRSLPDVKWDYVDGEHDYVSGMDAKNRGYSVSFERVQ